MLYVPAVASSVQAGAMAMPALMATAAIRTATACGDNAAPASQMTTNATAVPSLTNTTRSVKWPAQAERKSAIAVKMATAGW